MKFKKLNQNDTKKSFVYRIQDAEKPMFLNYYEEYDSFYLSIPKEVCEDINSHISSVIDTKYVINIDPQYQNASIGVVAYDETKERITNSLRGGKCRVADIVIAFREFHYKNKTGLSKVISEILVSDKKQSYMIADDFFEDLSSGDSSVDEDAAAIAGCDDVTQANPELGVLSQHECDLPF